MKGANLKKRRWGLVLLAIAVLAGIAQAGEGDPWKNGKGDPNNPFQIVTSDDLT